MESRGIIMFNRGEQCIIRAMVCLYTLRKYWDGPVTFYLETPYPKEFDDACKYFDVDIIHNEEKHEYKTLVRKTDMFANPPYDRTLWIDADMVILGKLDEMFDYLDDADVSIPHFCKWISSGNKIAARIKRFNGLIDDKYIKTALDKHPAVNTGILSFKKSEKWTKFVQDWVALAHKGGKIFISDEVAFQILYPSASEWGLKVHISPPNFNVSVLYGNEIEDKRVIHYHGRKHVLDVPLCNIWKSTFKEMCDNNIANIKSYLKFADKRLAIYLKDPNLKDPNMECLNNDVTIVSACDEKYVDILRETFANWRKYKKLDEYPVIIYVNNIPLGDPRLDFLRLPNVIMIPWEMKNAENHREEILSAFVYGPAKDVKTEYWMKLDADSYATNYKPLVEDFMKKYDAFIGHKWSYSRPEHIKQLDAWAKGHWQKKLKNFTPMITQGKIDGNRFYHNNRRTISFIQLHKTKFSRFCIRLVNGEKLPCPSHDTYYYYIAQVFNPTAMAIHNFKKCNGFTQGNGKLGVDHIRKCLENVELQNEKELDSDYKDEMEDIGGLDVLENKECICQERTVEDEKSEHNYIDRVMHSNFRNKNLEYEVVIREK